MDYGGNLAEKMSRSDVQWYVTYTVETFIPSSNKTWTTQSLFVRTAQRGWPRSGAEAGKFAFGVSAHLFGPPTPRNLPAPPNPPGSVPSYFSKPGKVWYHIYFD